MSVTKNIKFHEAVEKMKSGDVFSPYNPEYGEFNLTERGRFRVDGCDGDIILTKNHFNLEGDIITAEPKVLTAERLYFKHKIHSICILINTF